MKHQRAQKILIVLAWLAFFVVGCWTVYRAAWSSAERTDYTVYLAAGRAVLDGSNIYDVQNGRGWNYVYPPAFALLLPFFAVLPKALGALIWYLLSALSVFCAIVMSVRMLEPSLKKEHTTYLLYALPLLSLSPVLIGGLMRCQASVFMIVLTIGVFYFYFQGKTTKAGFCLAAAVLIKVFPVTLLAYFVVRRQWKILMSTFVALFILGIVLPSFFWGVQGNIDYIVKWINVVAVNVLQSNSERAVSSTLYSQLLDSSKPRNQSLEALFLSLGVAAQYTKYAVVCVAAVMFLVMALVANKVKMLDDKIGRRNELILSGAFCVWQLLISPISENHYFGMLLMPVTIIVYILPLKQKKMVLCAIAVTMLLMAFKTTEFWRPLCLLSLLLWGVLVERMWLITKQKSVCRDSREVPV